MTRLIMTVIILGLLAPAQSIYASEPGTPGFGESILHESRMTREAVARTLTLVRMDREQLEAEFKRLSAEMKTAEMRFDEQKTMFKALLDRHSDLEKKIESEAEEIKNIEDAVFNGAQKTLSLIAESPITAEYPQRLTDIDPLITRSAFPGMDAIRSLVDIIWTEMEASGDIHAYTHELIGPDFNRRTGDIVRIGSLCAVYRLENGDAGYLRLGEDLRLMDAAADLPRSVRRKVARFVSGAADYLPVDVSGGGVFKVLSGRKSLGEWIEGGGFLIWPIFLVGAVALLLCLERLVFLMRIRTNSDTLMTRIHGMIEKGDFHSARTFCETNNRYPTCRVIGAVFDHLGMTLDVMENAIQEAILRQIPRLERFIATLAVLAAIAPLLGLLGTVTGMINTFQIITLFGTGDPKLMSGGISEALITTQIGLAVAIPIMLAHHFLERRVDNLLGDIEEKGNTIILTLLKKGAITRGDNALAA